MKKRSLLVALLLVCMAVLSSCGCKHEWTEADCLNPKTCTLCEAVEGEALGHDWQAADCETPKTCLRCGLTEGESLGHSYGKWAMAETEMTRTCEACGGTEAVEPDYGVYLQQEMEGHWDTFGLVLDGQAIGGNSIAQDALLWYMDVTGDRMSFYDMDQLHDCTWSYDSHEASEEGVAYWVRASNADESFAISLAFLDMEEGEDSVLILFNQGSLIMRRNQDALDVLEGTWLGSNEGKGYRLNIFRDGTFTADLDGEISGTWHLRSVGSYYGGSSVSGTLQLCYTREGEEVLNVGNIYFGSTDADWSTYRDSANISFGEWGISFQWAAEDQISTWETALAEGPQKLLGEWTGTEERCYDYNSGKSVTTIPEGYSVTFLEDGTFTAVLGEETIGGIWYLDNVSVSYGNVSYNYKWKQEAADQEEYNISMYNTGKISWNLPSGRNSSRTVEFMQLTEENLAAAKEAEGKPLGLWTSTSTNVWDYATGQNIGQATTAYTVEFFEDGTFTATLDQTFGGKWRFSEVYEDAGGTSYMYQCEAELDDYEYMSFSIHSDGTLYFNYNKGEASVYVEFAQMDESEKAALEAEMEEAKLLPVGTWVSHTYTTWDSNTQQGKDEPHSSYTLTINADGTLTGQLEGPVDGTWNLSSLYHGEGYTSYSFGSVYDQEEIWYLNYSDGLILSRYEDGISYSYTFEKQ